LTRIGVSRLVDKTVSNTLSYPPACVRWLKSIDVSETVPSVALVSGIISGT